MKITIISGSRADYGLLEPVAEALGEEIVALWGLDFGEAFYAAQKLIERDKPDMILLLGDRFEILAAAIAAHLNRVKIAHIGGGDITEGSYDDAMRDCISRMASVHFVTSTSAMGRLSDVGLRGVHLVGNPAIDYIRSGKWKRERPIAEPYVVVNYQPETIDGTVDMEAVIAAVNGRRAVCFLPNKDAGIERVVYPSGWDVREYVPHAEYLNLVYHCEELIGNSSSILYEAPFFDPPVKTCMIGKRQRGRVQPCSDANAAMRIQSILQTI